MNKVLRDQVIQLPRDEKIDLIMDAWNSLSDDELPTPTPEQLAEAQRRLEEHKKDPGSAIPYEEVLRRLESRFK
jgi:putative addiction module component (TIGR02574 family)